MITRSKRRYSSRQAPGSRATTAASSSASDIASPPAMALPFTTPTLPVQASAKLTPAAPGVHQPEVRRLALVGDRLAGEGVGVKRVAGLGEPGVAELAGEVDDDAVARLVLDADEGADVAAEEERVEVLVELQDGLHVEDEVGEELGRGRELDAVAHQR